MLADLLRRLLLIIKLLLVHFVLSSEKCGQFGSALLKVSSVLFAHFNQPSLNNLLLNYFVGFMFPLSSQREVLVSGELSVHLLQFLKRVKAGFLRIPFPCAHGYVHLA